MRLTTNLSGWILGKACILENPIELVDIGANPVDGDPPYKELLNLNLANLVGFEPQPDALNRLLQEKPATERYYPYAIGDGLSHTLHIYQGSGLASLLRLDPASLDIFCHLKPLSKLLQTIEIQTVRLDDVTEISQMDFLKIDIQGGELAVFQNAKKQLLNTLCIQTEVSFIPLYIDQPTIGEVDLELREQGFIPHCFAYPVNTGPISPVVFGDSTFNGLNQLGEADMVYVRDFRKPDLFSNDELKKLALIAHHCYGSIDLVARCLFLLTNRGEVDRSILGDYLGACAGLPLHRTPDLM